MKKFLTESKKIFMNKIVIGVTVSLLMFFTFLNFAFAAAPGVIFTVNGARSGISIPAGYMTIEWKSVNTASCTASASGNTDDWSGTKSTTGAVQIFSGLAGSVRYTITCSNESGNSVSSSVVVNVLPQPTTNGGNTFYDNSVNTNTGLGNLGGTSDLNNLGDVNGLGGVNSLGSVVNDSCNPGSITSLKDLIMNLFIGCLLKPLTQLLIGISLVVFLWGIFKFVKSDGDDKQAGRELMFWGIVALFVMISMWGLVAILRNTFNFSGNESIAPREVSVPSLNTTLVK